MARSKRHALVRGKKGERRVKILAWFGSEILAQEAMTDVGCWTSPPEEGEEVYVLPMEEARERSRA